MIRSSKRATSSSRKAVPWTSGRVEYTQTTLPTRRRVALSRTRSLGSIFGKAPLLFTMVIVHETIAERTRADRPLAASVSTTSGSIP